MSFGSSTIVTELGARTELRRSITSKKYTGLEETACQISTVEGAEYRIVPGVQRPRGKNTERYC